MNIFRRVSIAVGIFAAMTASAGVNEWTSVGPDGGSIYGGVNYLARPGTAVAVTLQGIYRTTDSGANWIRTLQFYNPGVYAGGATNWNPAMADQVLAHGDGSNSVLRSTDGGQTWTRVPFPDPWAHVSATAFTRNGAFAWAGTSDGRMFRSADGGATWEPRSSGLPANAVDQIEVDATDHLRVYVRMGFDIWRTDDAGANWARVNGTVTYTHIAASRSAPGVLLAVQFPNASTGTTIYRSTDGGDTFASTGQDGVYHLQFFTSGSGRALAINNDREALYTDDDGLTWTTLGRLPPGTATEISFDPADDDHVLVATNSGMAFSQDAGLTWSVRHQGVRHAVFGRLVRGNAPSNYLYAASYDHELVYRRDSASGDWIGIASAAGGVVGATGPYYMGQGFDVSHAGQRILHMVREGRYGRSTDDGASWEARGNVGDGRSLVVDPLDAQIAYVGGLAMPAMKTTNGGVSWTPLAGGLPLGIEDFVIHPTNTQIVYAAKSQFGSAAAAVYKSIDGGATWSPSGAFITDEFVWRLVMHPTRPETLYAATLSGVWVTNNGGASWAQIFTSAAGAYDLVVDPQSPDTLYVSGNWSVGQSARSVDGGATWESLLMGDVGVATPSSLDIALVPGQPATLINARASYGLFEMEIAPDLRLTSSSTILVVDETQDLTLTAINDGPFSATNVVVSVGLPAIAAAAVVESGDVDCSQDAQSVTCLIPVLRSGQSLPISLSFTPTAHDQRLHATISAYESDTAAANNTLEIATERRADLRALLTSSADTAQTGTTFTYTLTVENSGPSAGETVQATLTLPTNVTFSSIATNGLTCVDAARIVTCDSAALAAGASASATITVNAEATGTLPAELVVTGQGVDPTTTNNSASKTVTLANPPPPPPPPPTSNPPSAGGGAGSGGKGGGGSLDYLLLGILLLIVSRTRPLRPRFRRDACA